MNKAEETGAGATPQSVVVLAKVMALVMIAAWSLVVPDRSVSQEADFGGRVLLTAEDYPRSIEPALPSNWNESGILRQKYRLFYAGFDVGVAQFEIHVLPDGRYYVDFLSDSDSAGLVRFLVKWKMRGFAWGYFRADQRPASSAYQIKQTWNDQFQQVEAAYQGGEIVYYHLDPGMEQEYYDNFEPKEQEQLMTLGQLVRPTVLDPLNMMILMLHNVQSQERDCTLPNRDLFVTEGPYRVGLQNLQQEELLKNGPSPFTGDVMRCLLYGGPGWIEEEQYAKQVEKVLVEKAFSVYFGDTGVGPFPVTPINITLRTSRGALKIYLIENEWTANDPEIIDSERWNEDVEGFHLSGQVCVDNGESTDVVPDSSEGEILSPSC